MTHGLNPVRWWVGVVTVDEREGDCGGGGKPESVSVFFDACADLRRELLEAW